MPGRPLRAAPALPTWIKQTLAFAVAAGALLAAFDVHQRGVAAFGAQVALRLADRERRARGEGQRGARRGGGLGGGAMAVAVLLREVVALEHLGDAIGQAGHAVGAEAD